MLRYVLIDFGGSSNPAIGGGLFGSEAEREEYEDDLLFLLEQIAEWNQRYLKAHPNTPRLYDLYEQGKVVYKRPEQMDPHGSDAVGHFSMGEHFRTIPAVIENGGGDCDNLSPWRVAELRNAGYKGVRNFLTHRVEGDRHIYHAQVWWPFPAPKGSTEDPSILCGMGGTERAADRDVEVHKNLERKNLRDAKIRLGVHLGILRPPAQFAGHMGYRKW